MDGMTKATKWKGNDLKGHWRVTIKIDGVRAFLVDGSWVSRASKPLYNIPTVGPIPPSAFSPEGVEVYNYAPERSSKENFKATIQAVRAKTKDRLLTHDCLYGLGPLDDRLHLADLRNPTAAEIGLMLRAVLSDGHEGLVLRQDRTWLKVKPMDTYDVRITGAIAGVGKHAGRLGALTSAMGNVGTGFTDAERTALWRWHLTGRSDIAEGPLAGQIMEVACMHLTPDGKFRHPRFVRLRFDKEETDA